MTAAVTVAPPGSVAAERSAERAELREAAQAFEAILVQRLIHTMVKGQLKDGFFGGGAGSSVYEGLFERHLAEHLSNRSPLGLAERLEEVWTRGAEPDAAVRRGLAAYREALDRAGGEIPAGVAPGWGLKNPAAAPILNIEKPRSGSGDDR